MNSFFVFKQTLIFTGSESHMF